MSSRKYVIGTGALLEQALAGWAEIAPTEVLQAIDIGQDGDYRFDMRALDDLSAQDATAFVAWGPQFLNFRRLELMGELKYRGFRLPPLIGHGALVAPTATIGENCAIGAGTIVGSGCRIGFNAHIGAGVLLGGGSHIGSSVWIADGVQIGATSKVGSNATLGQGVLLGENAAIGRQCILDRPGWRTAPLPDKTFVTASFPAGVVIVEGHQADLSG